MYIKVTIEWVYYPDTAQESIILIHRVHKCAEDQCKPKCGDSQTINQSTILIILKLFLYIEMYLKPHFLLIKLSL